MSVPESEGRPIEVVFAKAPSEPPIRFVFAPVEPRPPQEPVVLDIEFVSQKSEPLDQSRLDAAVQNADQLARRYDDETSS
jgi:hypothetical protein